MRGWENVTQTDLARMRARSSAPPPEKKPKYRNNAKATVGDQRFDSEREARDWVVLRDREQRGEISNLQRQVTFTLYAPCLAGEQHGQNIEVCTYTPDFVYIEDGRKVVQDSKGVRTREYRMKRRWLEIQEGIVVRET